MKNWRPPKWDEIVRACQHHSYKNEVQEETWKSGIEDGADLILAVLKQKAFRLDMENLGCGFTKDTKSELEPIGWWAYGQVADSKLGQGHLVFIPDNDDD